MIEQLALAKREEEAFVFMSTTNDVILIMRYSCSTNIEALTVSLRPYYSPTEFSHVIVHIVYVPNCTCARSASLERSDVIHKFESSTPHALTIVNGDFNQWRLK